MATIQPTDFSKLERFSNVADGITYKIILSFLESALLVIVPDRYDVELSIKSAERLRRTENSVQEIEIISDRKMSKSFQSYLSNASYKMNMMKYVYQLWKEILSEHLSSYQSVYLASLNGTTDFVTKECSRKIKFYCGHEKTDTKMFVYI